MITYAEQQGERKAEYERLSERYGSHWRLAELRQIDAQARALLHLGQTGWLPEEKAK